MTTLTQRLGREFRDPALLQQALTHKSFHNENLNVSRGHNERLEFLGDAVLDLALSDILMREFPLLDEGDLSKLRASLVNEAILAEVANEYGFAAHMRLGRGETQTGGAQKPRLLASVFEAFVGALYLDAGFDEALSLLKRMFNDRLKQTDGQVHFARDYKTRLQELTQEIHRHAPQYLVIEESGPDHDKTFIVVAKIGGRDVATGRGRSKKTAEQDAARLALEALAAQAPVPQEEKQDHE
ncbi:MAG: ribonuclease III [Bdellovibrionales bacterium]